MNKIYSPLLCAMFHYFNGRISQGFIALYSGRMILRIAGSLLGLFIPIFLYELFGFNFEYVVYYYLLGHLLYGVTVALGCRHLNKIGISRSLKISIFFGAGYYLCLFLIEKAHTGVINFSFLPSGITSITVLALLSIIILTIDRIMFWTPLHTDIAKFTSKTNRGKQLSMMEATTVTLGAIMPLAAGWILMKYNYDLLFIIALFIYLAALIPFMTLPKTNERFCWTYWQTWKEFFSKKRRKTVLAYLGDGAEDVVGIVIWPVFIWELLEGNYFEVGALSSLIVAITVIMQLAVGKFADLTDKKTMLKWGSMFYAFGWIIKIFIATAFQIFVASTYHNLAKIFARTPFNVITYERAADQGHYVDEYTVIHEMAIQFGKVLMLLLVLLLIPYFGLQWTFILAAGASLAMNFLADDEEVDRGRHSG